MKRKDLINDFRTLIEEYDSIQTKLDKTIEKWENEESADSSPQIQLELEIELEHLWDAMIKCSKEFK